MLQVKGVDAFFQDRELMPMLEQLRQLTLYHLLNVPGVLSFSVDWLQLESVFWC